MTHPRSAIVIGAGVVGVATAYALARRNIAVQLVERREAPAMETSHANGAQLSYLYTDALANPGLLTQMPKLALGLVPAFRMQSRLDIDYLRWIASFLRNCTQERFRTNTLQTLQLGLESRIAMEDLAAAYELDFGLRTAGKMQVYRSEPGWKAAQRVAQMKAGPGVIQHALDPAEAMRIEPALMRAEAGIMGVLYSPEEAVGDPHRFACAMLDLLTERFDVQTFFGKSVGRLRIAGDGVAAIAADGEEFAADIAIDCSGAEAGTLLRALGIRLPIIPMKGYSFTAPASPYSPQVSITDVEARIVFTRLGDAIRIAGLADLGNTDRRIDPRRTEALVASARKCMPAAAAFQQASAFWTGLRPMTPDAQPRIARPHPRVAYNLGHGMLGWTLAMGSAERLARLVLA